MIYRCKRLTFTLSNTVAPFLPSVSQTYQDATDTAQSFPTLIGKDGNSTMLIDSETLTSWLRGWEF